ncbi:Mediator of DNA damage checkpoint protein 1 [Coemansia erecta]|nr:Mediator of DNA damage checkpoint protein 1 [Coemansia erecta]
MQRTYPAIPNRTPEQEKRTTMSCKSSPASIKTQPYDNTEPFRHGALVQSSPISADKLYATKKPSEEPSEAGEPRISAILYKRVSDNDNDKDSDESGADSGPLSIHLFSGVNLIGQPPPSTADHGELNVDQTINKIELEDKGVSVVIEIDQEEGVFVLHDCGSTTGVFLGHRRTRVRPGIRYFLNDGKLVRLGSRCFWFHAVDNARGWSRSPSPPWNIRSHLAAATAAAGSSATLGAGVPAADANKQMVGTNGVDSKSLGRRAVVQPGRLRRETAAAPISTCHSIEASDSADALPLFLLGSPDTKSLGLTQMVDFDAGDFDAGDFDDMDCALSDTQPTSSFSPDMADDLSSMIHCDDGDGDGDGDGDVDDDGPREAVSAADQLFARVTLGLTQAVVESQPRLLTQDSHYQAPSQLSLSYPPDASPRISGLRVAESPRASPGLQLANSPLLPPNLTAGPSQMSQELPATQPNSPARQPPKDNDGNELSETEHLPQPSAMVYAPSRVVLAVAGEARPRYPYDFDGLGEYLKELAESTPRTQSDPDVPSSEEEGRKEQPVPSISSDFSSQQLLSPPPIIREKKEPPVRGRLQRHRRSIDRFIDSGSSSSLSESDTTPLRTEPSRTQSAGITAIRSMPSQRFNAKPLGMSARSRIRPQPQLKLLQSSGASLSTPWLSSRSARSSAHTPFRSGATTPIASGPPPPPTGGFPDGFPDDDALLAPLTASLATRTTQRALRSKRRHTQGGMPTLQTVSSQRTRDASGTLDTPTRSNKPSRTNTGELLVATKEEETLDSMDLLPSSPQLPHPSVLLQSRSADDTPQKQAGALLLPTKIPRLRLRCRDAINDENANGGWTRADEQRTPEAPLTRRNGINNGRRVGARRQSSVTPTGHRGSLRETLRKLPGARGVSRTGLTSKRRTTLRSARAALHTAADSDSLTSKRTVDSPVPDSTTSPHSIKKKDDGVVVVVVMFTGFEDSEQRERMARVLETQGVRVTDDPLEATVCVVSSQRLSRTLKVLCAMGRGIPIVTTAWLNESPLSLSTAQSYILCDQATEAEWGISLRRTLDTAAKNNGSSATKLFAGFCVYVARDVESPSPKSLATMIRAAGGHLLNNHNNNNDNNKLCATKHQQQQRLARKSSAIVDTGRAMSMEIGDMVVEHMFMSNNSSSSSSSTEPDDDSDDEDWTIESVNRSKPRKAAKTTKKRNTPLLTTESPSVDEPKPTDAVVDAKTSGDLFLDPSCGRHDMDYFLSARRAELLIPDDTRLLVISASEDPAIRNKWAGHQALVVLPELIIQSIIHGRLMF